MKRLLKKRSKRARKTATPRSGVSVDISRAIPGYAPADDTNASKPAATVTESPSVSAAQTQTVEDTETTLEQKYEGWLRRDLLRLTKGWSAVERNMSDRNRFNQLQLATHDLKGMGTTYGYPVISRLASSLDALLKTKVWQQNTQLIKLHIDACRAAANNAPATESEIDAASNAVCEALETHISELTANNRFASYRIALSNNSVV